MTARASRTNWPAGGAASRRICLLSSVAPEECCATIRSNAAQASSGRAKLVNYAHWRRSSLFARDSKLRQANKLPACSSFHCKIALARPSSECEFEEFVAETNSSPGSLSGDHSKASAGRSSRWNFERPVESLRSRVAWRLASELCKWLRLGQKPKRATN